MKFKKEIEEYNHKVRSLNKSLKNKDITVVDLRNEVQNKIQENLKLEERITELNNLVEKKDSELKKYFNELDFVDIYKGDLMLDVNNIESRVKQHFFSKKYDKLLGGVDGISLISNSLLDATRKDGFSKFIDKSGRGDGEEKIDMGESFKTDSESGSKPSVAIDPKVMATIRRLDRTRRKSSFFNRESNLFPGILVQGKKIEELDNSMAQGNEGNGSSRNGSMRRGRRRHSVFLPSRRRSSLMAPLLIN